MTPSRPKQAYYRAWFQTLNGFVDDGVRSLDRSEMVIYLILMRESRPDGTTQAALTDLAARGGLSKRTASRAIQSLIRRGVLHVVRQGVVGNPTVYTCFPPAVFEALHPNAARSPEGDEVEK